MRNTSTAEYKTTTPLFKNGFLLTFAPLAILLLPLFFHQSVYPQIGPYNLVYFLFLLVGMFFASILSSGVGWACSKRGDLHPLFWTYLAILVISFSAVSTEVFLRFKFRDPFFMYEEWGHRKSILFGFEAKPNHRWKNQGAVYTTDSHGFRIHMSGENWEQAEGGVKMFILGASSAFGYGLNDQETWPSLLENRLRSSQSNPSGVYVINAANSGHNSLQTLLRFYLKVLPLKPTHVIFYENINDVGFEKFNPETVKITDEILFSKSMGDYVARVNQGRTPYRKTLLSYFIASKLLPSTLTEYLDVDPHGRKFRDQVSREQREILRHNGRLFITHVRTLAKLCELYHVKLILTTFLYNEAKQRLYARSAFRYHNQLLRGLADSEHIPLIDLERDFQNVANKELYFSEEDHYHPTRKGAQFIADTLAAKLIEKQLL